MIQIQEDIIENCPGSYRAAFPEIDGGYELTASWPLVQAVGKFDGLDFYFRAKDGEWEFHTEDKEGQDWALDHRNNFVRRGKYDEQKLNALSLEWTLRILRKCFMEFWEIF